MKKTINYKNGEKYIGETKNNKPEGKGKLHSNPSPLAYIIYDGQFKNGKYHGSGTWRDMKGQKYSGQFKNGEFDGKGKWTDMFDTVSLCEFKNGETISEKIIKKGKPPSRTGGIVVLMIVLFLSYFVYLFARNLLEGLF